MKKYIPFLLTLLLLAGCAAPAAQEGTYRQITMDEAIVMMEEESNYIILMPTEQWCIFSSARK